MHSAEKQLAKGLFLMAKAARSEDLKKLLEVHRQETRGHAAAIEQVAESLRVKLPRKSCRAMKGLIKEGVVATLNNLKSPALDSALIAAGIKIEHYEIASYRTLCRWANAMRYTRVLAILISILNQEELAETLLVELSRGAGPLKEVVRRVSLKKISATIA